MFLNFFLHFFELGNLDIWAITVEERAKHDQQFHSLKPTSGFITGNEIVFAFNSVLTNEPKYVQNCLGDIWA